jgi:hypothetical protein
MRLVRVIKTLSRVAKDVPPMSTISRSSSVRTVFCAAGLSLALCFAGTGCRTSGRPPSSSASSSRETSTDTSNETIVVLRHGEKAIDGLGQLNCTGLNRSLALPKVLIGRFGRAHAIFSPSPAYQMKESALSGKSYYSYVRPLATIEPTAIQLGLPVDTQLPFKDIAGLQDAVTAPAYANSTIFIAWEHKYAYDFARQMLHAYGLDRSQVPPWPSDDFDTMYVFHIIRAAGAAPTMTFAVQQEGLSGSLSAACPSP